MKLVLACESRIARARSMLLCFMIGFVLGGNKNGGESVLTRVLG